MIFTRLGQFLGVPIATVILVSGPPARAQSQQPRNQGWPCTGTVDPLYVRTAEATGGVVMLFASGEIAGAAAETRASRRHSEIVFRASATLAEGVYDFDIPLDSTIESAYVFASMQCLQSATVMDPSGQHLRTDATGVEHHAFDAIRLYVVPAPVPGTWRVSIAGRGFLSLVVKAATKLKLTTVRFATGGVPVKRQPQRLEIRMSGEASEIAFEAVSSAGAPIARLALDAGLDKDGRPVYVGEVAPPRGDFRVAMTGTDANGFRFQRVGNNLVLAER